MLHLIGTVLILLCGWCGGCCAAERLATRRKTLEQTVGLMQRLMQEIRYRKSLFAGILVRLKQEEAFPLLDMQHCRKIHTLQPPRCLNTEEKKLFCECFSGVGHQPADEECKRLTYYAQRFETLTQQARQKELQGARLYPKLGLCMAAMLAITLL